jgi:hypothetical protein
VLRSSRMLMLVLLLIAGPFASACTVSVEGVATPGRAEPTARASEEDAALPGGAEVGCLRRIDDDCGSDEAESVGGVVCDPLPTAMEAFDASASAAFPSGRISPSGSPGEMAALGLLVTEVVARCGFQVMIDIAYQYPDPVFAGLVDGAIVAMGPVADEPGGLLCADLADLGYSAKEAVDYWFYWGGPDLMDADLNGTPCESVYSDAARFMPSYY